MRVVPACFLRKRMLQQPASGNVAGLHQRETDWKFRFDCSAVHAVAPLGSGCKRNKLSLAECQAAQRAWSARFFKKKGDLSAFAALPTPESASARTSLLIAGVFALNGASVGVTVLQGRHD